MDAAGPCRADADLRHQLGRGRSESRSPTPAPTASAAAYGKTSVGCLPAGLLAGHRARWTGGGSERRAEGDDGAACLHLDDLPSTAAHRRAGPGAGAGAPGQPPGTDDEGHPGGRAARGDATGQRPARPGQGGQHLAGPVLLAQADGDPSLQRQAHHHRRPATPARTGVAPLRPRGHRRPPPDPDRARRPQGRLCRHLLRRQDRAAGHHRRPLQPDRPARRRAVSPRSSARSATASWSPPGPAATPTRPPARSPRDSTATSSAAARSPSPWSA